MKALNICLAGTGISEDSRLTRALGAKHNISLLGSVAELLKPSSLSELAATDLLILDCGEQKDLLGDVISNVTSNIPHLGIVLVNGGLTTNEIAHALGKGATDYLAIPATRDELMVLAERVEVLGFRARQAKAAAGNGGDRRAAGDGREQQAT